MTAADIIEITLDRGPCFGPGPVFRFSASLHAGYRYVGRSHAEPVGERSGGMPGYLFDRLSEVCVELRVPDLDDDYPSDIDDVGSLAVTVRHAGGVKVIRSECGDAGPVRLWAFAALIEVVMRQAFETEERRATTRRGPVSRPAPFGRPKVSE